MSGGAQLIPISSQLRSNRQNIYNTKHMELPKFILGDNTDLPNAIFVIHTEFPMFIINLEDDEVEWLEDFDQHDQKELELETENLISEATAFYDREVARYDD